MANLLLRRNQGQNVARTSSTGQGGWDPFRLMDTLLRWDPYQEAAPAPRQGEYFVPAFEVKETKDSYLFHADMPGVKESDVEISLTGNQLTISGKRESEREEDVRNYYTYERSYGSFSRSFTLPQAADAENVRAELKDGVLSLVVPKKPELQPRRISVGGGAQTGGNGNQSRS